MRARQFLPQITTSSRTPDRGSGADLSKLDVVGWLAGANPLSGGILAASICFWAFLSAPHADPAEYPSKCPVGIFGSAYARAEHRLSAHSAPVYARG